MAVLVVSFLAFGVRRANFARLAVGSRSTTTQSCRSRNFADALIASTGTPVTLGRSLMRTRAAGLAGRQPDPVR